MGNLFSSAKDPREVSGQEITESVQKGLEKSANLKAVGGAYRALLSIHGGCHCESIDFGPSSTIEGGAEAETFESLMDRVDAVGQKLEAIGGADSGHLLTKRAILLAIGEGIKSKIASARIDLSADNVTLAKQIAAALPGMDKDASISENSVIPAIKMLVEIINKAAKETVLSPDSSPAKNLKAAHDYIFSLAEDIYSNYSSAVKGLKSKFEDERMMLKMLESEIDKLKALVKSGSDPQASVMLEAIEVVKQIVAFFRAGIATEENLLSTTVAPLTDKLNEQMEGFKETKSYIQSLEDIRDDTSPSVNPNMKKLAEKILGETGSVAVLAARISEALKAFGLTVAEIKKSKNVEEFRKKLVEVLAKKIKGSQDVNDADLFKHFNLLADYFDNIRSDSANLILTAVGGASRIEESVHEAKLRKLKDLRAEVLKMYNKELGQYVENIYENLNIYADIGMGIPVSDELEKFADDLAKLGKDGSLSKEGIIFALVGFDTSALAKQIKDEQLSQIKRIAADVDKLLSMSEYSSIHSKLREVKMSIESFLSTLETFTKMISDRFGMDLTEGGAKLDELKTAAVSAKTKRYQLEEVADKIKYFIAIARVRSSLERASKEIATFSADYTQTIAKVVGEKKMKVKEIYSKYIAILDDIKSDDNTYNATKAKANLAAYAAGAGPVADGNGVSIFAESVAAAAVAVAAGAGALAANGHGPIFANAGAVRASPDLNQVFDTLHEIFRKTDAAARAAGIIGAGANGIPVAQTAGDNAVSDLKAAKDRADEQVKFLRELFKEEYEQVSDLYELAEGIENYLMTFTQAINANPDAVNDLKRMLDNTESIINWYDAKKAGETIAEPLDMVPAYAPATIANLAGLLPIPGQIPINASDDVVVQADPEGVLVTRCQISVNMLIQTDPDGMWGLYPNTSRQPGDHYYDRISNEYIGDVRLKLKVLRDFEQVKKLKQKIELAVTSQSALKNIIAAFFSIATSGELKEKPEDSRFIKPVVMYRKLLAYFAKASLKREDGLIGIRRLLPNSRVPNGGNYVNNADSFESDTGFEDHLFMSILKAIVTKMLVIVGVYNLFQRPFGQQYFSPLRTILGGGDSGIRGDKVSVEVYVRLLLLAEFYREFFKFNQNETSRFSFIPEVDGTYGELIKLVFRKYKDVTTGYSDSEITELVQCMNDIMDKSGGAGNKNLLNDVINGLVFEINRRYELLKKAEYDAYDTLKTDLALRRDAGLATEDTSTDLKILPGEDGSDLYVPESAKYSPSLEGLTPEQYKERQKKIDAAKRRELENFRMMLLDKLNQTTNVENYKSTIESVAKEIATSQTKESKISILGRLLKGDVLQAVGQNIKHVMFKETVVAGLHTLGSIYSLLTDFRSRMFAIYMNSRGEDNGVAAVNMYGEYGIDNMYHHYVDYLLEPEQVLARLAPSIANAADAAAAAVVAAAPVPALVHQVGDPTLHALLGWAGAGHADQRDAMILTIQANPLPGVNAVVGGALSGDDLADYRARKNAIFYRIITECYRIGLESQGLIKVSVTPNSVTFDYAEIKKLIGELMLSVKYFLDLFKAADYEPDFRPPLFDLAHALQAERLNYYIDEKYTGSYYWLEERLVNILLRGIAPDANRKAIIINRPTEAVYGRAAGHPYQIPAAPHVPDAYKGMSLDKLNRFITDAYNVAIKEHDKKTNLNPAISALVSFGQNTVFPRDVSYGLWFHTQHPINRVNILYDTTDKETLTGLTFEGLVPVFNAILAKYLATTYDTISKKLYKPLINDLVSNAFATELTSKTTYPDMISGAGGDVREMLRTEAGIPKFLDYMRSLGFTELMLRSTEDDSYPPVNLRWWRMVRLDNPSASAMIKANLSFNAQLFTEFLNWISNSDFSTAETTIAATPTNKEKVFVAMVSARFKEFCEHKFTNGYKVNNYADPDNNNDAISRVKDMVKALLGVTAAQFNNTHWSANIRLPPRPTTTGNSLETDAQPKLLEAQARLKLMARTNITGNISTAIPANSHAPPPVAGGIIYSSIAEILSKWAVKLFPAAKISPEAVVTVSDESTIITEKISDISVSAQEKLYGILPVFERLFTQILRRAELLKNVLQDSSIANSLSYSDFFNGSASGIGPLAPDINHARPPAGEHYPVLIRGLFGKAISNDLTCAKSCHLITCNDIVRACYSILACIKSSLADIPLKSEFLEPKIGYTATYKSTNGHSPVTPFSIALSQISQPLTFYTNPSPEQQLFTLGTRSFMNLEFKYDSAPGVKDIQTRFNTVTESRYQIEESKYSTLVGLLAKAGRFNVAIRQLGPLITGTNSYNIPSLSINDAQALNAITFINVADAQAAPVNNPTIYLSLVMLNYNPNKIMNIVTTSNIDSAIGLIADTASSDFKDRDQLRIANLRDLNIVPININMVAKEVPFTFIYNYAYTFDRMMVELFASDRQDGAHARGLIDPTWARIYNSINQTGILNKLANDFAWPKIPDGTLVKLLINPYAPSLQNDGYPLGTDRIKALTAGAAAAAVDVVSQPVWTAISASKQSHIANIEDFAMGKTNTSLGRPKFISDQLFNKVFLSCLDNQDLTNHRDRPEFRWPHDLAPILNDDLRIIPNTRRDFRDVHGPQFYHTQNQRIPHDEQKAIGQDRFDTFYIRTFIFFANLQRVLKYKLQTDLLAQEGLIGRANALINLAITEYYDDSTPEIERERRKARRTTVLA